jgi:hypothetical protein
VKPCSTFCRTKASKTQNFATDRYTSYLTPSLQLRRVRMCLSRHLGAERVGSEM